MNYKRLIAISIILLAFSLASVSASEFDQSAIFDSSLDDDLRIDSSLDDSNIAAGLETDSSYDDSLDIDNYVPESTSDDSSIDDDEEGCPADAADDGAADTDEDIADDDDIDSDITDDDSIISNITNDTPKPKYNDAPISNIQEGSGSFAELQSLIDALPENTVLVLARDYTGGEDQQITINKNLIIDGQGHTIDCAGVCRAFYSTSGNIALRNLNIVNGHYDTSASDDKTNNGGAIWIGGTAKYTLENCKLLNNWADDMGGAIYNDARNRLTIINCTFNNNKVDDLSGGAVYSSGEVYIENSTFEGNHAYEHGGAICLDGVEMITVKNSIFKSNEAVRFKGGAIYTQGEVYVENSAFENNIADGSGGAIYVDYYNTESLLSKIINSVFTSNKGASGGAIYCYHNLFIDGCNFTSNVATADGGAVDCTNNLIAQNSIFCSNAADYIGGALEVLHNVTVINCTFDSNKADGTILNDAYGGAINAFEDLYINNCTFDSNLADDYGGAIACENAYINYYQDDYEAYNTFFNGNTADDLRAGAVYCRYNAYIKNTAFTSNKAYTDGGALYIDGDSYITHCLFDSNKVRTANSYCQGGAIYGEGTVNIFNCIFKNNYAQDDGGAIYGEGTVNVDDSTFDSNGAGDNGGAIYASTVNVNPLHRFSRSKFINNTAYDDNGGAIYGSKNVNVYNALFKLNRALVDGGAIFADNLDANECDFVSNRAEGALVTKCYGGAIRATFAKIIYCVFDNNFAENHGGAVYVSKFTSTVQYCKFINNQAKTDGGAVYIDTSNDVLFSQCTFVNNTCGDEGGAIYLDSTGSALRLIQNLFIANHAADGIAVFNKGGYKSITHNWWGDKNPTADNHMLVEWKFWTSNENHVDPDPLGIQMMCSSLAIAGKTTRATFYFIDSHGAIFGGAMPTTEISFILPDSFKAIITGYGYSSACVDFVASKTGTYNLYGNLFGQLIMQTVTVLPGIADVFDNNADYAVSNIQASSAPAKNMMANAGSSKSNNVIASINGGLKTISADLNRDAVEGQYVDASIINHGIFNPIVKSIEIPQSNGDFDFISIILFIASLFVF